MKEHSYSEGGRERESVEYKKTDEKKIGTKGFALVLQTLETKVIICEYSTGSKGKSSSSLAEH